MITKEATFINLAKQEREELNHVPWWRFSARKKIKKSIRQSLDLAIIHSGKNPYRHPLETNF